MILYEWGEFQIQLWRMSNRENESVISNSTTSDITSPLLASDQQQECLHLVTYVPWT